MDDSTRLAIAIILGLIAVAIASFEVGWWRGQRDGHDAQQCADEMALVAEAKGRHPAWRASAWTEPPSRLDHLDGITDPPVERHHTDLPPVGGSAGRSAGDQWLP